MGGDGYGQDGESAALRSARTWTLGRVRVRGIAVAGPAVAPSSRLLPGHLPQLLPRRVAGALAARRAPGGGGGTVRGPARRTAALGPKFAGSPGRPSGSHVPLAAPSRILTPASLRRETELRPG